VLTDYEPKLVPAEFDDQMTHYKTQEDEIWVPYDCKYKKISYSYFAKCLEKNYKVMHFYGDSNTRRSLKAVTTGGAFCNTWYDKTSSTCQCWDRLNHTDHFGVEKVHYYMHNITGRDIHMYFYFAHGFIRDYFYRNFIQVGVDWESDFHFDNFTKNLKDFQIRSGQPLLPKLLVISAVNWDASLVSFEWFQESVSKFIKMLNSTYKNVSIIWRTAQYYHGHIDDRKWILPSHMRMKVFNDYLKKELMKGVGERLRIWDVEALGRGQFKQAKERVMQCHSNHMTRDGIDIENQIWMNMLCS
jgi:hypothetical protein